MSSLGQQTTTADAEMMKCRPLGLQVTAGQQRQVHPVWGHLCRPALPTLVLGAEATLAVVAIRSEVQSQPVLAADDGGWEAGSGEPVGTGSVGEGGEGPQLVETGHPGVSPLPMCAGAEAPAEGRPTLPQPPSNKEPGIWVA